MAAAVAAVAFWFVFRHQEYQAIDASLTSQQQVVISGIEGGSGISLNGGQDLPGETQGGIAVAAILVTQRGRILDESGQVKGAAALAAAALRAGPMEAPLNQEVGGRQERILVTAVGTGGSRALLILARPIGELQGTLALVAILLVVVIGVLVVGAASLGYWLAGRALQPVRIMSATARDISEHDLHRRIVLDLPPGDELGELAATFNAMLRRLEGAFEGLQRFTADAAHELRAPLALMRTQVDVMLRRERSVEELRASHESLLGEIERLSRMADQLLLLARADAGALAPRPESLDVADLLESIVDRWRPAARERGLALESRLPMDGAVDGDPDLLRRMFDNLLDNALRHTPPGGSVSVTAAAEPSTGWRIAVEDTGPGIDPALGAWIFERFTRADAARRRETGGAGLGLSLCAAIVRAHRGSIALERGEDGAGARFVVRLPAGSHPARRQHSNRIRSGSKNAP